MVRSYFFVLASCVLSWLTVACDEKKSDDSSASGAEEPGQVVSGTNPDNDSETGGGGIPNIPNDGNDVVVPPPSPPTPSIAITGRPYDPTFNHAISFAFSAENFTATSFTCALDTGSFAACTSPHVLTNLSVGRHVFVVRAENGAETVESTYAWTIDRTIEKMPITSLLPGSAVIQDYVETSDSQYFSTNQGFVYSRDGGKTATVRDASSGMPTRFTYKLEVVGDKVFIATQQGLVVSTDKGVTLSNKTTANGLLSNFIYSVFYHRPSNRLVALNTTGLSYSDDDGQTFTQKTTFAGTGNTAYSQIYLADDGRVFALGTDNNLYTAASLDGTYSSIRSSVTRIFATRSGKVYAANNSGIHFSSDGGTTFTSKSTADGLPSNTAYTVAASEDGLTIVVGTAAGYAFSVDGGQTFTSGSISSLTGGSNTVGRVILTASGHVMITDQTTPTRSSYQLAERRRDVADTTPPSIETPTSLVQAAPVGSGVSLAWSAAADGVTNHNAMVYEVFTGAIGTDFANLKSIYLNGDLAGRYTGVSTAPVYLNADTDKRFAVVAKDQAGNKSIYSYIDGGSGSTAAPQSWSQAAANAGMGKLVDHRVVANGAKLYMVGGIILDPMPITVQNKVYESTTGSSWSEVVQTGSDAERADHGLVAFDGKLWISGGYGSDTEPKADVAYSTNGATWTVANANAAFGPRRGHGMVVFNGKMWVIGGNTKPSGGSWSMKSDVWYSTDGINWQQATANAGFIAAGRANIVATSSYMYFIGEGTDLSVWRSANGSSWEKILDQRPTGTNFNFAAVAHDGALFTIGGSKSSVGVWKSPDGVIWENIGTGSTIPQREDHAAVSFANKLWMFQGTNSGYQMDAWSGH